MSSISGVSFGAAAGIITALAFPSATFEPILVGLFVAWGVMFGLGVVDSLTDAIKNLKK